MEEERMVYLLEKLQHSDPYKRSETLLSLATKKRDIFPVILPLTFDPEQFVRRDALIALGATHDSRAYFFLANYFSWAEENYSSEESRELQKSVLFAFRANRDPRARELLEMVAEQSTELNGLASSIIRHYKRHPIKNFLYTYVGKEEERLSAEEYSGTKIQTQADIQSLDRILEEDARAEFQHFDKPQTYVVNEEGDFLLGGQLHEHVQVASGKRVLAAGEAYLQKDTKGLWFIESLNNRSHGYYPHAHSFFHIKNALSRTNISFPPEFSKEYPKEGWVDPDLLAINASVLFKKHK